MPTVVILLAHGSRAPEALDAHRALAASVAEVIDRPVRPAFLEMADPDLPMAIATTIHEDEPASVVVIPHFLAPGNHVARDVPALIETARRAHPDTTIVLADFTGNRPEMVKLVADAAGHAASDLDR